MKRNTIILAMLALGGLSATAQINSPQSTGYETRAAAMLADGNFQGCIDQCKVALQLGSNRREQLSWLSAVAAFNGGMPESRKLISEYVNRFPHGENIVSARLMLATLSFYDGEYKRALKMFDRINANSLNDNEREDLLYRRAYCMMQLGDYIGATSLMQELSRTRRYGSAATFYEAYMAFVEGDYDYALDLFGKCDKAVSPGNMADYYIAQMLFKRSDYAGALNLLMPLMARKNVDEEFRSESERIAGECYYALHDDNRAMVYLNAYMAKHADTAPLSTRYIVGVERYQTGDFDEALSLLAPVSELKDEMGQSAALTMGQAYMGNGNFKSALMAFDKAVKLDFNPQLTELAYYNYAVAQVDGGRIPFGNSVQTLEDFIKRYPNSRYANSVREYLVKGYMATDDYAGALRSLNAIKDVNNESLNKARQQVNFVLGTRELQRGNAAAATGYLTAALKYGSYDSSIERQTRLWLGDAYYSQGKYKQATEQYKAFLATAPGSDSNRPVAQYNLAYSRFAEHDYTEARKMFEAVVASRNQPVEIRVDSYNRIGDTYYYSKQLEAAKNAYTKAYDMSPADGDYSLLQIAIMEGHMGDMNQKIATLEKLIANYPNSSLKPSAMTERAQAEVVLGKTAQAIAGYKKIVADYHSSAFGRNAMLQIAILTDNGGDTEGAIGFYRQVITDYPTSSEAALAVQDLKRIYGEQGRIEELNAFLESVAGAPQLDATERNAIAAASLLKKARQATTPDTRKAAAEELLTSYPDADGAEEAMLIAAQARLDLGVADKALSLFSELEQRASTPTMRHNARLGIIRSASEMSDWARVIATADNVLKNASTAGVDLPEVKFLHANALSKTGDKSGAEKVWAELAKTPTDIYGTRAAYELAACRFNAGNLNSAASTAEKLIDANPPHAYWLARTFILYSDILRAQGSDFEADEYLRALRSNYPGTDTDIFHMIDKRLTNNE